MTASNSILMILISLLLMVPNDKTCREVHMLGSRRPCVLWSFLLADQGGALWHGYDRHVVFESMSHLELALGVAMLPPVALPPAPSHTCSSDPTTSVLQLQPAIG